MASQHPFDDESSPGSLGTWPDHRAAHLEPLTPGLGPVAQWPASLRSAVEVIVTARSPAVLWWGPELVAVSNRPFRELLGDNESADEIDGPGLGVSARIWQAFRPAVSRVLAGAGASWSADQQVVIDRADGQRERYITVSATPVMTEETAVVGVLCAVADTTERVLSERRLAALAADERGRTEALVQLDEAKDAFFTNISHELRTPLTLIAGPVRECLADDGLSTVHRHRLAMVDRNITRLARMVDAILDFDRMRAGRLVPDLADVEVSGRLRTICAGFAPAFAKAGLDFDADCPPLPRTVRLDVDMLERIVLNLLSNALKYTPRGSVRLRLDESDDGITITVTDTGVGISERDLPRIFERFEQVPVRSGSRSREGAGIGLAMVKELTELMAGSVAVTSHLGSGSTFTVRLPWSVPPPAAAGRSITPRRVDSFLADVDRWQAPMPDPKPAPELDSRPTTDPGAAAPRLLIAEDNPDMAAYLGSALRADYDLRIVGDGTSALTEIRRRRPDLLLADVMMPGTDGFTLTRQLRADPEFADLPILLLSARTGDEATSSGLHAGADDYLVKPFSVVELRARLASNLARARARLRDAAWRRAVLAALHDALVIVDADGSVVEVNEAFTRLLGWTDADVRSRPLPSWWPDFGAEPAADESAEEFRLLAKDGREVWAAGARRQVDATPDVPVLTVCTMRDISRDREARQRRAAAARLSADFGTATDLTTVLEAAVAGFAQLFNGHSFVRIQAGVDEQLFTMSGPVRSGELEPGVSQALAAEYSEQGSADDVVSGLLMVPAHPESACRVWVQFPYPRAVTTDERIVGDLLSQAFALAVDRVVAATGFADRESHFQRAIESHRTIGQAVGILIERHRVTSAEAFNRLTKASQNRNIKLRDIAMAVIETGLDPEASP